MFRAMGSLMLAILMGTGAPAQEQGKTTTPVQKPGKPAVLSAAKDRAAERPAPRKIAERIVEAISPRSHETRAVERHRQVIRLKNTPAVDVAKTIDELVKQELQLASRGPKEGVAFLRLDVLIVPDAISNSLLVSGSAAGLEAVARLVAELDRQPAMVVIRAVIAEAGAGRENKPVAGPDKSSPTETVASVSGESAEVILRRLAERGAIKILARPEVTTLNNQPAFLQVGQRVPTVTGTTSTAKAPAGQVSSYSLQNVGLILGVTPRVSIDGRVAIELDLEKSELGADQRTIQTITFQTTVTLQDGQTAVIGRLVQGGVSGDSELLLLVTAEIAEAGK